MKVDNSVSKSWFCVFNNPEEHKFDGTPQEIVDKIIESWIADSLTRTCAVSYCISAEGLKHCHAVLEDTKAMRFSTVKKAFPAMHISPTKGNKEQAEDYINKRGQWKEKGEEIIYINRHGEIRGFQGQRTDLEFIQKLIEQGLTPNEIFELSIEYRKHDRIIRDAYYHKRIKETPMKRNIMVIWHMGESGSGKSHTMTKLAEEYGEDDIYIVSEYKNGFDKYNGERILFMDEFRGQLPYALFLTVLDGYKVQISARYSNVYSLWTEVHIATVLPPEEVYKSTVDEHNKGLDTIAQLKRRIDTVVYHYKRDGAYFQHRKPMSEYKDYKSMVNEVDFVQTPLSDEDILF